MRLIILVLFIIGLIVLAQFAMTVGEQQEAEPITTSPEYQQNVGQAERDRQETQERLRRQDSLMPESFKD